jgi:acyl-CoA synthetase (AMP-forming)/AMP-acid ligase II
MTNSVFINLDSQNNEIDKVEVIKPKIDTNKSDRVFVSINAQSNIHFIRDYLKAITDGGIPLVMNPSIPEKIKLKIEEKVTKDLVFVSIASSHILTTSGTTSDTTTPKSFLFDIDKAIGNTKGHYDSFESNNENLKVLFPLPLTHSFGLNIGLWGGILNSNQTYLYEKVPAPTIILKALEKYEIDILYLTPSLARMIIKFSSKYKKQVWSPKIISIGSSFIHSNEINELMKIFSKSNFYYTYGLTEMGPRVSTNFLGSKELKNFSIDKKILSIGKPLQGIELKIEKTLKIKSIYSANNTSDEFYDSQDLAIVEDNEIFLQGRVDDTIIFAGINIFPDEVELLVKGLNIGNCALVGLPSKLYGRIPILVIEEEHLKYKDMIKKILNESLPQTHIPHDIIGIKRIPVSSLGKVLRRNVLKEIEKVGNEI